MRVRMRVPRDREMPLEEALAGPVNSPCLGSFSGPFVSFCEQFSAALSRHPAARKFPELTALAFGMRRAEIMRLGGQFRALATDTTLLVPRGLVFHVAPANVDTIAVYSWLMSAAVGNNNIIQLSSRRSPQAEAICAVFDAVLARPAFRDIRIRTCMIEHGHDAAVTSAISARSDMRVIWGGDATVRAVRAAALPAHARELTFPDRYSMCAICARPYLGLADVKKRELARRFFNDAYWFDQAGCSSPRLVVWCGRRDDCRGAAQRFFNDLRLVISERGYAVEPGVALEKINYAYRSVLDQPVTNLSMAGSELIVLSMADIAQLDRSHCGGGLFLQFECRELLDIAPAVRPRDQTLTHFGFSRCELRAFVMALNGGGMDRIVPIGQALQFGRYWDGCDLLQEFSRRVHVEPSEQSAARLPRG